MGKGTDKDLKDVATNFMTEKEFDTLHVNPTPEIIKFLDQNGNPVGRLFMKDGKLDFEGDATQAAQILFDGFKRHIQEQLMEVKPDAT